MATVLVVDDRPVNRELLSTILGYKGHRVLEAGDGAEGLVIAKAERPELIITDMVMPTMDGYEFVRRLRADPATTGIPVIFNTAHYLDREAAALAKSCGVSLVMYKPNEPETVLNNVETALGQAVMSSPAVPEEFDREHLRLITDKLADKAESLRAVNERFAALIELGQQLASEHDPFRLLEGFSDSARRLIGARYAAVSVLDDDQTTIRHFITSGMDDETRSRIGPLPAGHGLLGEMLSRRGTLRMPDIQNDHRSAGFPENHPIMHSFLGATIATKTRIYGSLYLTEKLGMAEFSADDEKLVAMLASEVAVTYENAKRFEEIERHSAELQQEIAERKRMEQSSREHAMRLTASEEALRVKNEELKAMTEQLWQAAKLATVGELAASIAHELNNPLAIVSLRVDSLLSQIPGDDSRHRSLSIIEQEVERMANLVSNLLQFSRRRQRQVSTIDVRDEIANTLELVQHYLRNCRINLVQESEPGVQMIQADRQQLRQVFLNVLTNAADAMPRGGTLKIRVTSSTLSDETPAVRIEFVDTGAGIPAEELPKVVEPFYSTKPEGKGTGLGLAICKRIVVEHHGTFEITSEPGKGTTVCAVLPAATAIEESKDVETNYMNSLAGS